MSDAPDLIEVVGRIADALEGADIDYAVGGALALGIWAEPRGTRDIDVAVYGDSSSLEGLFQLFERIGGVVERDMCRWQLDKSGYFAVEVETIRVDVFLPDLPLYDWARPRRVRVQLGNALVWFWSPEDLILFKMLFFRTKDKADIESILQVQQEKLDLDYIRRGLKEILSDEERTCWFDEASSLASEFDV